MSQRILIGLDGSVPQQGAIQRLVELGATEVQPIEGIPDALVAYVEDSQADDFIRQALQLAGVRHAERDQLRSTF